MFKTMFLSPEDDATITLDVRVGTREKDEDVNAWKDYAASLEERQINCKIDDDHVRILISSITKTCS